MNTKIKIIVAILLAIFLFSSCGGGDSDKKISIAYANWAEGIAMTHLAKAILQEQDMM